MTSNKKARSRSFLGFHLWILLLSCFASSAATVTIYTNDFEAYSNVATNLDDVVDVDPTGDEWNVSDDVALNPTDAGAGVQVINWLANSGSKSLLLRSSSEAQVYLNDARSGSSYQLDFWLHIVKGSGNRSFMIILRGQGADSNGDDYIAYRSDRAATKKLFYYDGTGPGAAAWVDTGVEHIESQWQHHRIIVDANARTMNVYIDDMENPVVAGGELARPDSAVPMLVRIIHEGNSADDGYVAIDDIRLTVEGSIDLATTFTDGFESYPARTSPDDDANPQGPWITVETAGAGSGRTPDPTKVQVVDSSVVPPRSGTKSLKLEGGHRAGSSIAWGQTPQSDVQITWWASVPEAIANNPSPDAMYLRMSLYGMEGASSFAGDAMLLGHGIRGTATPVGDATSLLAYTTTWVDTGIDFTPVTWEQYRLTTHVSQGLYTIVKNPSSANPEVIVDRGSFIGTAGSWGPMLMAAWSSSNGTNHPAVYVDDIEIKSLVSIADPLPDPYTVTNHGTRFTNSTIIKVGGLVGSVAVDPRDNSSILFTKDDPSGGIYRAQKVAGGNWSVDAQPIVSGLDRPSGLAIGADGTIWWTHDFTPSLKRLKAPWESNVVEEIISNFGPDATDDDPIDVTIAPASFNGILGAPNRVVVADRGSDGDAFNALFLVDPATTTLNQSPYTDFLVSPTTTTLGSGNLNAITALPQSGEVVTLSQDGYISAVNGDGVVRNIFPAVLWQDFFSGGPAPSGSSIAVDPTTGWLWIADDLRDEVWSVDPNPETQSAAPDAKEVSFPLSNADRPDLQLDMHDPGMAFAPNGDFVVLTDGSVANGGGRLIILHNEAVGIPAFSITSSTIVAGGIRLTWESVGAASYQVQRSATLGNFQDISGDLTVTEFTDTTATGTAFYRVVAKP